MTLNAYRLDSKHSDTQDCCHLVNDEQNEMHLCQSSDYGQSQEEYVDVNTLTIELIKAISLSYTLSVLRAIKTKRQKILKSHSLVQGLYFYFET